MDEHFCGWGGEDDAMSIKLQSLSSKVAIANNTLAWHLWHPRDTRYDHDDYQANKKWLQQYLQRDKAAIELLCQQQYPGIGKVGKYRTHNPVASKN
jgi:hypothetical protein